MWIILIIACPAYGAALCMHETSRSKILCDRHRYLYDDDSFYRPKAMHQIKTSVTRVLYMMFTEPLVFALAIYTGFAFAVMFSFFESYPLVFTTIYGFSSKEVGLSFLSLLLGFLFAALSFSIIDRTPFRRAPKTSSGRAAPEARLYAALIGSFLLPISLFW